MQVRSRSGFISESITQWLCITVLGLMTLSGKVLAAPSIFELFQEAVPGAVGGDPGLVVEFNGELFFEAEVDGTSATEEPFRFDGTNVIQIPNANPPSSGASNLTTQFVFANRLYAVMESNVGRELFQYNTTTQQYELHTNLNGAGDGFPSLESDANGTLVVFGGHLMMEATDTATGDELFRLRSDTNVLELFLDIVPGATGGDPGLLTLFNGELFFEAETMGTSTTEEPYRFDGTNIIQIVNANPPSSGASNLTSQFVFANRLYAVMESNVGRELFQYNTTTQQYELHTNLNGAGDGFPSLESDANGDLVVFGGHLMMEATDTATGDELFRLRSDTNVLELFLDIVPGTTGGDPGLLQPFGGQLFFEAETMGTSTTEEPYRFDGTNIIQITNANPPGGGAASNLTSQFVFNGEIYAVMESNVGRELFVYNQTAQQYELHTNLNGAGDGFPSLENDQNGDLTIFQGNLILEATDTATGDELFRLRPAGPPPVNVSINDVALTEGNAGTSNLVFTVTRDNNGSAFTVDFATANSSATAGSDYVASTGMVTFTNGGPLTQTITIQVNGDTTVELNETFLVNLSNATNGATLTDTQGIGTINNNDLATLSINDVTQAETDAGTTAFTFTVTLDNAVDTAVSVDFDTANGTAVAGVDYFANTGSSLNFAGTAGETETLTVQVTGDTTVELNETFFVNLSNLMASGRNVSFADNQGDGTIINDDAATISINDITQNEGNAGTTAYTFTVTLNNAVDLIVSVDFDTANGSAIAGSDFIANSGTLNFSGTAGETETVTVQVTGDNMVELNENLFVNLSNIQAGGRDVTFSDSQGVGTITNDDTATLSISDVTQNEGTGGTTNFAFNVTLDNAVDTALSAVVNTADNSATAGSGDYTAITGGSVNFAGAAGEIQAITVIVGADSTVELDESFFVNLSGVSASGRNVSFADNQGDGTIINDDAATISIDDVTQAEGNAGAISIDFSVTLSAAVDVPLSVDTDTADDTATVADNDYAAVAGNTLNFVGTAGEVQTLSVSVNGDTTVELDETFFANLSNILASGRDVTFADSQGVGTITNDDAATISIDDVTQAEGNAGTSVFTFTVTLDNAVDTGVSLSADSADDTATVADNDYVANTGGSLNFVGTMGETQTFMVTVNGDTTVEPDETFFANLSNLSASGRDVTFADAQGLGTISNDDAATLVIDDVTLIEGNAGVTGFDFTVTLDSAVAGGVSVDFTSADVTALAGSDYTAASGTLNFVGMANETQTITVNVNGDTTIELDETFAVDLSGVSVTGVMLADAQGIGSVTNDDAATIVIDDVALTEGNTGTTAFTFTATLDSDVDTAVDVDFATSDGSATVADNDYVSNSGTLNFVGNSGEMQTLTVQVNGDTNIESDESFVVDLSNLMASGRDVTLADPQGTGTIINDEPDLAATKTASFTPPLGFNSVITYTVTLTNSGAQADQVMFTDTPDTEVDIVDGTVTSTQGTVTSGNGPGDTIITIDIGTVAAGATVTINYDVEVGPFIDAGRPISNQGTFFGLNFPDELTDDPSVAGAADPTVLVTVAPFIVPTLSQWALVLMTLLLAVFGVSRLRRQG